jgi:hypothetical protein
MKKLSRLCRFSFLIFLTFAIAACHVEDDNDVVVTIPPEYAVDLFENRAASDGTPTFGLWVESMEKYRCTGFGIAAQVAVQNDHIGVTILGVTEPAPCVGDSAPARQFIAIGHLTNGTYEFSLSLRDVIVNEGSLTVASGQYTLFLPEAQGVVIENFTLASLPDGIVWGYAATPDEASQPVADDFLADLKTLTAENGLVPGFYSYFTISGTGNISFHKSIAPVGTSKHFVRQLNASPDALKGILQNYRDAAQQPLSIKCWTTEGEL